MNIEFRKPNPDSKKDILELIDIISVLEDMNASEEVFIYNVRRLLSDRNTLLLVAVDKDEDRLCATCTGFLLPDISGGCKKILFLENLAVSENYQGREVGKAIFSEFERWGRENDASYINLCSALFRKGAHSFYHRIGCEEVKGFRKYFD